jgi:Carboxypeptidase regulatory-like domain
MTKMSSSRLSRAFAFLTAGFWLMCFPGNLSAQIAGGSKTAIPSGGFHVAGIVVSKTGGQRLAGARVVLTDTRNPQSTQSVVTSDDARFSFQVQAGKYSLQALKRGYISAFYNQHEQFSTAIVAGAGLDTENLVLPLAPDAVLFGKVFDEFGDPVRNARVTVYREDRQSGVTLIHSFRQATTDDQGTYEVIPLGDGTYFVSAAAKPWYAVHPFSSRGGEEAVPSLVEPSLDVAYPITYYGDATEADDAMPIPIRGGDRIEADIHLSPVPALHLLVHVSGDGTHGFNLPVFQKSVFDEVAMVEMTGSRPVGRGIFEVTGIPAGRYAILGSGDGQMKEQTEVDLTTDRQELEVSSGNPTSAVKAAVRVAGNPSLPSPLTVLLRNNRARVVARSDVDAKGEVDFQNVPAGEYTVLASAAAKPYSVKIESTGGGPSGRTLNVPPGSSLDVRLLLVGGEVTVEGVAKQADKPVSGAMVVLVPKDPESNRELFRRDQSDQDGTFSLPGVIPGVYTVIAIEGGWDLDWGKPAVLAQYTKHGQVITVGNQAKGVAQLPEPVEVQPK